MLVSFNAFGDSTGVASGSATTTAPVYRSILTITRKARLDMRFKNVFFYVDFYGTNQTAFSYRAFVYAGKGGREWLDSALNVSPSLQHVKFELIKRFRNKLRSVQLQYSPAVSREFNLDVYEVLECRHFQIERVVPVPVAVDATKPYHD